MNLLECKDLSIGYNGKTVHENISFTLEKGDFLCIFGKNGCGKSTLVKTILGLIPPVSGTIQRFLEGNKSGYLGQQKEIQKDFPCGVKEVIMSGFQNDSLFFYSKKQKSRMIEICNLMGIADLLKKSFKELSGGQQQKVLLARALCASQELLVLDEPSTGLDTKSRESLFGILQDLNKNGITIILISHNLEESRKLATKILELSPQEQSAGQEED